MTGVGGVAPDAALLTDLRRVIDRHKFWVSPGAITWIDAGGRPRGYKLREHLAVEGGIQPATLYVDAYFKTSTIAGVPNKLSVGLFYRTHRVIAIDENGFSRHFNSVGVGRPHYLQHVDHPQLHTISDDAIYGYAEPISRMPLEDLWSEFLSRASISGAPHLSLPIEQFELKGFDNES